MTGLMRKRDSLLSISQSRNGYQPERPWWPGEERRGPLPLYATVYGLDWWIWWSMITDQISISLFSIFFLNLISLKCFILMYLLDNWKSCFREGCRWLKWKDDAENGDGDEKMMILSSWETYNQAQSRLKTICQKWLLPIKPQSKIPWTFLR